MNVKNQSQKSYLQQYVDKSLTNC